LRARERALRASVNFFRQDDGASAAEAAHRAMTAMARFL
jgi:hypothetical protein